MRRFFSSAFEWMNVQLIFLIQRELSICHGNFNDWKETHKKEIFSALPYLQVKKSGEPKRTPRKRIAKNKAILHLSIFNWSSEQVVRTPKSSNGNTKYDAWRIARGFQHKRQTRHLAVSQS